MVFGSHFYFHSNSLTFSQCRADEPKNMIVPILGHEGTAVFFPNGTVMTYKPLRVVTHCHLNVQNFPFDMQSCKLQLGSWAYELKEVELNLYTDPFEDSFQGKPKSSAWEILSISADYQHTEFQTLTSVYIQKDIVFTLSLKRKPSSYISYIIVPGIMLDTVALFTFLLPIRSGERINVCLTTFLAYSFQLLILSDKVPEAGDSGPEIGEYGIVCGVIMMTICFFCM